MRIIRNLSIVFVVELALVLAIVDCQSGCVVVVDPDDEPTLECPGDLFCECSFDDECDAFGLGGERGRCAEDGHCTIACESDDDCNAWFADATCGPMQLAGQMECTLP